MHLVAIDFTIPKTEEPVMVLPDTPVDWFAVAARLGTDKKFELSCGQMFTQIPPHIGISAVSELLQNTALDVRWSHNDRIYLQAPLFVIPAASDSPALTGFGTHPAMRLRLQVNPWVPVQFSLSVRKSSEAKTLRLLVPAYMPL